MKNQNLKGIYFGKKKESASFPAITVLFNFEVIFK